MPFAIGPTPVIRTVKYLEKGPIHLNSRIKIFSAHTILKCHRSFGLSEFIYWHLPQIQYKNPDVHCIVLRNMTPTPFIRAFTDKAEEVIIDVDGKDRKEILKHVIAVLGKPKFERESEILAKEKKENPANFGYLCSKHCMCQIIGQVPCPSLVPVPEVTRGKYFFKHRDEA